MKKILFLSLTAAIFLAGFSAPPQAPKVEEVLELIAETAALDSANQAAELLKSCPYFRKTTIVPAKNADGRYENINLILRKIKGLDKNAVISSFGNDFSEIPVEPKISIAYQTDKNTQVIFEFLKKGGLLSEVFIIKNLN